MKFRYLRQLMLLLLLTVQGFAAPLPQATFSIQEGGQTNAFLDNDQAQVHVLVRPRSRLVFAFPAENSGIGIWFTGHMEMIPQSLRSRPGNGGQEVEARFRVETPVAAEKTLLDSIRVLRDYNNGADTATLVEDARQRAGSATWAHLLARPTAEGVLFRRSQPGGQGDFELEVSPAEMSEDKRLILAPGEVTVRVRVPFPPLTGYAQSELYRTEFLSGTSHPNSRTVNSLQALEFLVRKEKLMAGSWRFLTYFGRDTLIATAMLEPILSDQALIAAVKSVLTRLSPTGAVAHEEDIGPWAEWRHLEANEPPSLEPLYDYKMIDDDLLLPLLLAKLKENGRSEVLHTLLQDSADRQAILRNMRYVVEKLKAKKPLRLNQGELTGDWRDSHEGLGFGVYPASVNAALSEGALDAIASLLSEISEIDPGTHNLLEQVEALRPAWADIAQDYWITLSAEQVQTRISNFAKTLSGPRKQGFDKLITEHKEFLQRDFRFPVLSKTDALDPVPVPHTDVAFSLFYGQLDRPHVEEILTLLERPFPFGLKTPLGFVVANPVFSSDSHLYKDLGFGQYHGLVVWSWPSAMLQLGLLRQVGRFPHLDERLLTLLDEIQQSEERVGELSTSELWAIDLDSDGVVCRAYGRAGDQTESNVFQLWSTVYPALEYVRAQTRKRTAGQGL